MPHLLAKIFRGTDDDSLIVNMICSSPGEASVESVTVSASVSLDNLYLGEEADTASDQSSRSPSVLLSVTLCNKQ